MDTNKRALIIKNISREGPGLILDVLSQRKFEYTIIDLSQNDKVLNLSNYSVLFVLGGPDSINDRSPKTLSLLRIIKEALEKNIAILGICLGLQALVEAAGGSVSKCVLKEIGLKDVNNDSFTIALTKEGKQDPLFKDLDDSFEVFQLHGETVKRTDRMLQLGNSKYCKNQIVKVHPTAYGIQCHFELTNKMLSIWCDEDESLQKLEKEKIMDEFEYISIYYTKIGITLINNFLDISLTK